MKKHLNSSHGRNYRLGIYFSKNIQSAKGRDQLVYEGHNYSTPYSLKETSLCLNSVVGNIVLQEKLILFADASG